VSANRSDCDNGEVNRDDIELLFTSEAVEVLASLPPIESKANVVQNVSALRKRGLSPEMTSVVLLQQRLRTKAAGKFGEFAGRMLFTEDGLQQATRLSVAARHAARFRDAGVTHVADLGCGIGGDALAIAGLGVRVTAVDRDEVTAAIATYNLAPFDNADVVHGEAESLDLTGFDALWFDPARRSSSKRLSNPTDWSPSLSWVFGQAASKPSGIKLSPAIDQAILPEDAECQWIDDRGDTVECVVWTGALARPGVRRSALVLDDGDSHELVADQPDTIVPVGEIGAYLFDPCGAVLRAQLLGKLARELQATLITDQIAYLSNDSGTESPFAQRFRVREVLPLDQRTIATRMRQLEIGTLEIKKRGVDINPAEFRTKLKLSGKKSATLLLTRGSAGRIAVLADRV